MTIISIIKKGCHGYKYYIYEEKKTIKKEKARV